jgi:hypothetical protein
VIGVWAPFRGYWWEGVSKRVIGGREDAGVGSVISDILIADSGRIERVRDWGPVRERFDADPCAVGGRRNKDERTEDERKGHLELSQYQSRISSIDSLSITSLVSLRLAPRHGMLCMSLIPTGLFNRATSLAFVLSLFSSCEFNQIQ